MSRPDHSHYRRTLELQAEQAQRSQPARTEAPPPQRPAPPPQPESSGPRESGKRLATFPRPGRGGKRDTELRVTLDTFEGHAFVGARLWERGYGVSADTFFPTPRGVTVRTGELAAFLAALRKAAHELGVDLGDEKGGAEGVPSVGVDLDGGDHA